MSEDGRTESKTDKAKNPAGDPSPDAALPAGPVPAGRETPGDGEQDADDPENAVRPDPTEVRYLTPANCRMHKEDLGTLHVRIKDERSYRGTYAAYLFPVDYPNGYISLVHIEPEGKEMEIGVIRDLDDFPADQAALIRQALARRYFIHTIRKLHKVDWKYGFVTIDAETDKGRAEFLMRWKQDRAVDYGKRGKVLIDVYDNRYLIPDVDRLSPSERADFTRIIYW